MKNLYNNHTLTANNHLQYWFSNGTHMRNFADEQATMSVTIDISVGFVESLIDTAIAISSNHKKFYIFISGGLDSEVALNIFMAANIKVIPVIIKFKNSINDVDVANAIEICQNANLVPIIIDIDVIKFFESGDWIDIAKRYQCYTFYQQLLIKVVEDFSQPILRTDEIALVNNKTHWKFVKNEDQHACWHRFIDLTNIPVYPNFYTYNPSTIGAFLTCNTVQNLIQNKIYGKLTWTSSKHIVYTELTNFNLKPRKKFLHTEKILNIWDYVENKSEILLNNTPVIFEFDAMSLLKCGKFTCTI